MATLDRPRVDDATDQEPTKFRWLPAVAGGALAGLLAALSMTIFISVTRLWFGIPAPAELIGDTFIPNLDLDTFFQLIGRFNGGNGIKKVGIGSVLIAQMIFGIVVGMIFGALASREKEGSRRPLGVGSRALIFVAVAGVVAWLGTIIPLRGVLFTNYRGLPAGPATVLTVVGILLTYAFFAVVLVAAYRALFMMGATSSARTSAPPTLSSRRALIVGGITLGTVAISGGMLRLLYQRSTLLYDGTRYRGPNIQPITPNDKFYSVTKNILDPDVTRGLWRLRIDGLVSRPSTYTFDQLAALSTVTTQEATVSCISNDIGDGLVSNAVWKGVPLRALLEEAGVTGNFTKVVMSGADNYVDTILPDKALDATTFVAWEMNDAPLSPRHGYPVRVIVPGRFGEKSVKWVTRIEVVNEDVKGFYERQGWGPTFTTQTFSRFDAPSDRQTLNAGSSTQLHGIAFAGDRGISRVEVSTDDGKTWREAKFDYHPSKIVWTLWSIDWQPTGPGEYHLAVRAVDGTGAYQTSDARGIAPDGATGYHRITVRVA